MDDRSKWYKQGYVDALAQTQKTIAELVANQVPVYKIDSVSAAFIKTSVDQERKHIVDKLRDLELMLASTEGGYLAPERSNVVKACGSGIGYARECLNLTINKIEKK